MTQPFGMLVINPEKMYTLRKSKGPKGSRMQGIEVFRIAVKGLCVECAEGTVQGFVEWFQHATGVKPQTLEPLPPIS